MECCYRADLRLERVTFGIFNSLFRPNQAPVVNVTAAILIVLSVLPVWFAQRLAGPAAGASRT